MAQKPHTIDHLSFPSPLPTVSKSHKLNSGTKESSLNARQSPQQVSRSRVSQFGGQELKSSKRIKAMVRWQAGNFIVSLSYPLSTLHPRVRASAPGSNVSFFLHLSTHLYNSTLLFWGPLVTLTPGAPSFHWPRQTVKSRVDECSVSVLLGKAGVGFTFLSEWPPAMA